MSDLNKQAYEENKTIRLCRLGTVLVLILIEIFALLLLLLGRGGEKPQAGGADVMYITRLGELCESQEGDTPHRSLKFNEIILTNKIADNEGSFICFSGEISTEDFSFQTNDAKLFGLDLYLKRWESGKSYTSFEPKLSSALSEVRLLTNGEEGEMHGKLSLVFSIDEECFKLIKDGSPDKPESFYQIELYPSISWQGGTNLFAFDTKDTVYKEHLE